MKIYIYRGEHFNSLKALESFFCLREGAGDRLLKEGEIEVRDND